MVLILTQSYRESRLTGLIPVGVIYAEAFGPEGHGVSGAMEKLQKLMDEREDSITHVFNVSFVFDYSGHPSRNSRSVRMIGDGYRKGNVMDIGLEEVDGG